MPVDDVADVQGPGAGEPRTAAVKPAAMNGATAITANRMTRMADCRNANVRPRVWSSTSLPTIVYPVTYATPAHAPSRTTRTTTTTRFGISAISASGKAANVDRQAEQAAPAEPPQDAQAEEHAEGQADEDRGEDHAPARVAAVQGVADVDLPEADDHAGGRERADHPDHDPADHPGLADEPPALHDGLGHRRRGDLALAAAGISRSAKIVSADTTNVAALKYSARLTWLVVK